MTSTDAEDVAKYLNTINGLTSYFEKYPGQITWFDYFTWFISIKVPFIEQSLKYHDKLDTCQKNYQNVIPKELRDDIRLIISMFQELAQIFITKRGIFLLKMMAKPNSFYGFTPDIQLEIVKALYDLEKMDILSDLKVRLSEICKLASRIASDLASLSKKSSQSKISSIVQYIRSDCSKLYHKINGMKDRAEPFKTAQATIIEHTSNAQPFTTEPTLRTPANPNDAVERFTERLKELVTNEVKRAFHSAWVENTSISIDMKIILSKTKAIFQILKGLDIEVKKKQTKSFIIIKLCLQGILFIVRQISDTMETLNEKLFDKMISNIKRLPSKSDKSIIDTIKSGKFKYSEIGRDCAKEIRDVLGLIDALNTRTSQFQEKFNSLEVENFETNFKTVMRKLKKVQNIVVNTPHELRG